jgi:3-isopropylmalate/(R)-2-methylmalate dehydratase large subunit
LNGTLTQQIFSAKTGREVKPGEIVLVDVDFLMGQDGTSPLAIKAFQEMGGKKVFEAGKIAFVIDHSAPSPNQGVSELHKQMRDFAREHKLIIYDIGEGVCHQLVPEKGHISPGQVVIGADSHTCTYGALGAFATGVGSTDLAAAMISGKMWFKVPETILFKLKGTLPRGVFSKDLILFLIGQVGADGATYKAVEFKGEAISALSVEARFTISNMAIEMGGKAGLIAPDEKTRSWLSERGVSYDFAFTEPDDSSYEKILEFDVSRLEPQIAAPHRVDKVAPVSKYLGTRIDQAFLGTCTNGRLEDLEIAARILKGKKVHPGVRLIVAPASRKVLLEAISRGIIKDLVEAGAALVTPGCGCCVGTHNGVPASQEVVVSSSNRNFKGRMGNPEALIYLASPATVAASAVEGKIADPRNFFE